MPNGRDPLRGLWFLMSNGVRGRVRGVEGTVIAAEIWPAAEGNPKPKDDETSAIVAWPVNRIRWNFHERWRDVA